MIYLILITVAYYFFQGEKQYYPDSIRYETGLKQHYPFNLRLIRINFPFVLFIPILTYFYLLHYLPEQQAVFGGFLALGLSGIFRQNVIGFKLIDATAICFGLLSAILFNEGWYVPAVVFLILASLTKETMPIFIALWSMSFVPLAGFIVPAIVYLINRPMEKDILGEAHQRWIDKPFSIFKQFHFRVLVTSPIYFLTWGVCITAVLYQGQYWLWILAGVIVGYSQLLVATDRARLYQYSFPLVILATCSVIEFSWLLVLVHLFNPFGFVERGWSKGDYEVIKSKIFEKGENK